MVCQPSSPVGGVKNKSTSPHAEPQGDEVGVCVRAYLLKPAWQKTPASREEKAVPKVAMLCEVKYRMEQQSLTTLSKNLPNHLG